ncbi:TetR/AcrR family transcriptional regulator [Nocardia sp. NPDC004068]|uniref:TetR/AcrR family transcriptional regulator n=1 Tax=Nocardia sp. NPDC004068 TaxID=3364303 RepID=UPI00369E77FA
MAGDVSVGTRERLLAAAERLLLTEPYDAVSVRAICVAAEANPAAVHYHFGSKDELVVALLEDRLAPLWAERLASVTAAGGPVAAVVEQVLAPFSGLAEDPVGRLHLRLLARFALGQRVDLWRRPWFRMDAWVGLLPEVSARESRRRWALAFDLIILRFGGGGCEGREMSASAVAALRDFVVAGLTAPAPPNDPGGQRQ